MDNTLYSTLTAQTALQRLLDVTANNMANVSTAGFKRERLHFEAQFTPLDTVGKGISFVQDLSSSTDMLTGSITHSGNALDVAVDGAGMLGVNGGNGTLYTRDGRLSINSGGLLVQTTTGKPMVDASGASISIPRTARRVVIAGDGTITADEQTVGRLGLFNINANNARRTADGLFSAGDNPAPNTTSRLKQGYIEGSNVNAVSEMTTLINVQRAYERAANLTAAENDRSQKAIQTLGRTSGGTGG